MRVIAGSDWVIDIGPGAGEEGGRVVAAGPPGIVAQSSESRTAPTWRGSWVMDGRTTLTTEDERRA